MTVWFWIVMLEQHKNRTLELVRWATNSSTRPSNDGSTTSGDRRYVVVASAIPVRTVWTPNLSSYDSLDPEQRDSALQQFLLLTFICTTLVRLADAAWLCPHVSERAYGGALDWSPCAYPEGCIFKCGLQQMQALEIGRPGRGDGGRCVPGGKKLRCSRLYSDNTCKPVVNTVRGDRRRISWIRPAAWESYYQKKTSGMSTRQRLLRDFLNTFSAKDNGFLEVFGFTLKTVKVNEVFGKRFQQTDCLMNAMHLLYLLWWPLY